MIYLQPAVIPKFLIQGHLARTNCSLSQPFEGHLTVVHSEGKIKSIELQLVRAETVGKE